MFKRSKVSLAAAVALSGLASMSVVAQDANQRVEITGSNIRRAAAETASPVQVITKQEIEQSGKGTVAEYLQTLTADGQGSVPFTYGRGFAQGSAGGVSLRGLGANATLVLINGRRVTPAVLADDAQRTFVDLNQLPLEAVERVEVVKDGASAIYGSDAVAGVVNVILKKSFVGTVLKASYGLSQKNDGAEPRAAITHGMGSLEKDGWNLLLNAEFGKKEPIYYRNRADFGHVGLGSIGNFPGSPFNPNSTNNNNTGSASGRLGGAGWIPVDAAGARLANSTSASIIGNVRAPDGNYYSRGATFAAAQTYCNANANLPQINPAGGCLVDLWQKVGIVQPSHETGNFFGRFTKSLGGGSEAFAELGYYHSDSTVVRPYASTASGFFKPNGTVVSRTAVSLIGSAHPDNPFPGTNNRLSYQLNGDPSIGGDRVHSVSSTVRGLAGLKGTFGAWDYDTAAYYSEAKQTDTSLNKVNWRVLDALLNPTAANVAAATTASAAYAALPAGTLYRIGENTGLNSPALYKALLADLSRDGNAKMYGADVKVSREIGQLDGGPIGIAVGAEARREENRLPLYTGLGNYIGLALTGYSGQRSIYALYSEALLPVTKTLELNAALRYDNYSDSGTAVTPKVGAKWRPLPNLALRGTYGEGFRAPSSTENSATSIAAFGGATVNDSLRCLGTGVASTNCIGVNPTFVQSGNPALKNEKSKSFTLGLVWDITPKASVTLDVWEIKRTGLPVLESTQAAVDAGHYVRDPSTATTPLDPGSILTGFVRFVNSDSSLTRGLDLESKTRMDLDNGMGRVTTTLTWTHLLVQRVDSGGTIFDYAGTHGNCQITNCIGSPRDRIQFAGTWERGDWRLGANVNYRGPMSFRDPQNGTLDCYSKAITTAGISVPGDCTLVAFTTLDVSAGWKFSKQGEVFGSIQNLLAARPPFDYMTYGGIGYNPLDYSGAIGRYFRIGLKYKF